MSKEARTLVWVWVALLVLLSLTVGATFAPFGPFKPFINLAIAFAKGGLILWVFMHLREQGGVTRLIAVAAVAWLLILISLTQTDLLTRAIAPD